MIQMITCDKIIESCDEETKTVPANFNEKSILQNKQFLYFTCIFINYYSIIDSCQYLLLFDKILQETKTSITIPSHK